MGGTLIGTSVGNCSVNTAVTINGVYAYDRGCEFNALKNRQNMQEIKKNTTLFIFKFKFYFTLRWSTDRIALFNGSRYYVYHCWHPSCTSRYQ